MHLGLLASDHDKNPLKIVYSNYDPDDSIRSKIHTYKQILLKGDGTCYITISFKILLRYLIASLNRFAVANNEKSFQCCAKFTLYG